MKCPTCNAPINEDEHGIYFDQGKTLTEEIMVGVLKRYPDLLAEAVQWSAERNSILWQTIKAFLQQSEKHATVKDRD